MITSFVCPNCHAFSQQRCQQVLPLGGYAPTVNLSASQSRPFHWIPYYYLQCTNCDGVTFAELSGDKIVYPRSVYGPQPNADLPRELQNDFNEARTIAADSARGAAALLRLLIQKLCVFLGEKGENLNTDIANLVKRGIPETVQQSLDAVRVIGNNAVHPGEIAVEDNLDIVKALMSLVNIIALRLITEPKQVQAAYDMLPESARAQIEKRDAVKQP